MTLMMHTYYVAFAFERAISGGHGGAIVELDRPVDSPESLLLLHTRTFAIAKQDERLARLLPRRLGGTDLKDIVILSWQPLGTREVKTGVL